MNLKEMIEFDTLRYKQTRTVREQSRYDELEERVIIGADGVSEFDVTLTEGEKQTRKTMHDELCSKIAQRFFKDLAVYGPEIGDNVMKIVADVIKTLKP